MDNSQDSDSTDQLSEVMDHPQDYHSTGHLSVGGEFIINVLYLNSNSFSFLIR